ncbi:hypothetical protein BH20VER3_BH20VER3_02170 [soil metagenome]
MSQQSIFTLLSEPRSIPFEQFSQRQFSVLHAAGIINPFGPTLAVVARTDGEPEFASDESVVRIIVNPFAQECDIVGTASRGDTWNPNDVLDKFFNGLLNGCPTLLLPGNILSDTVVSRFCANFLMRFADWADVFEKVKRFPNDPWKRVQSDVNAGTNLFSRLLRKKSHDRFFKNLHKESALELAELLLAPEAVKQEYNAFCFAWNGAIEFQKDAGSALTAMPFTSLAGFFAKMAFTSRLPAHVLELLEESRREFDAE